MTKFVTKDNHRLLWNALHKLLPSKKSSLPNCFITGSTSTTDPFQISSMFNKNFSTIGLCLQNAIAHFLLLTITTLHLLRIYPLIILCLLLLLSKFALLISRLSLSTYSILYEIGVKIIKCGASIFSHLLAKLINLAFSTGIVPHYFKKAKVIPIYKSGANTDFSNYRPISILPVVNKLLERSVYDHLVLFISNNNMISQFQSGFRNLHSTITALTKLHNDLLASFNRRCSTGVACIDFRKAFDKVDR